LDFGSTAGDPYYVVLYNNGIQYEFGTPVLGLSGLGSYTITYIDFVGKSVADITAGHTFTLTIQNDNIGAALVTFPAGRPTVNDGVTVTAAAPCFTPNSQLLTPAGYVKASTLRTGDVLVTSDGRQVPIKAYMNTFKADKDSAPYLIPKNSLARNVPAADLRLSPWHAISLGNGLWQKPQTAAELNPGVLTQYDVGKDVQYYHFEAPNYFTDNFICSGTVVESFGSKQVSEKEKPYTWSEKHQAYTRNMPAKAKKHVAM
jgi:hypothetical protein